MYINIMKCYALCDSNPVLSVSATESPVKVGLESFYSTVGVSGLV